MTFEQMVKTYHKYSAATAYILGFVIGNNIYAIQLTWEQIKVYFKFDHMSSARGGWAKVRIRLTAEQREILAGTAEIVGTKDMLEIIPEGYKKPNRGDNFESIMLKRITGETWHKNSDPFWVTGDINTDTDKFQVKLDSAELTNEKTLRGLVGEAA